jgi:hypothetical protein
MRYALLAAAWVAAEAGPVSAAAHGLSWELRGASTKNASANQAGYATSTSACTACLNAGRVSHLRWVRMVARARALSAVRACTAEGEAPM